MFFDLIPLEMKKYKRTALPWILVTGGLLAPGVSMLIAVTGENAATWDSVTIRGITYINMLALLLSAVFTGFVFMGESSNHIDNLLFTYPVSRYKFLISKYVVLLFLVIVLYLIFTIFLFLYGFLYFGRLPDAAFAVRLLQCSLSLSVVNFVLVPLTAFVCMLVKGAGTGIFTGMAYFITNISFVNSKHGVLIPVCLPDRLAAEFFTKGIIEKSDIIGILSICTVLFAATMAASALWYAKHDVIH